MREAVIVSYARTGLAKSGRGGFNMTPPMTMAAHAIEHAVAKSGVDGVLSDAQDMGMEAVGAVREVGDNVVDAIDESLKKRPYTTLALAAGIGFLFGATWRR